MGVDSTCVDDRAVGSMSIHRYRRVHVRLDPGSLVFGEGADAAPAGSSRGAWGMRAMIEAVVCSFGLPRWWRRWPLFYGAGGADMAVDAAGHTSVPLCWGGLLGDPDMVLPPGEVFDHRGMLSMCLIYVMFLRYQFICDIDADTIVCLLFGACADVAPHGREVEWPRAPVQRNLERLPHGERRRRDEATGRPAEPERAARRHRFDDPGAGPSHAPPTVAGVDFDDIPSVEVWIRIQSHSWIASRSRARSPSELMSRFVLKGDQMEEDSR
jgi:hypothetical protein